MTEIHTSTVENHKIRHYFDEQKKEWLFSVVDVIGILAETSDPRNYWKVLKNRLNKTHKELVTNCNQLKMPGSDGKMYLTDTANTETLIEIASIISPANIARFKEYLYEFEEKNTNEDTYEDIEFELPIDGYQDEKNIFIKAMLAGVNSENLIISITSNSVNITGKRNPDRKEKIESSIFNELAYGTFSRTINLPEEINIDESEANISYGLLTIRLPKINRLRKRILKAKNI